MCQINYIQPFDFWSNDIVACYIILSWSKVKLNSSLTRKCKKIPKEIAKYKH